MRQSVDHRCFSAVCERGYTGFFFEKPDKVVGVLNAYYLADVYNLFIGGKQQFFRLLDSDLIQVLYGCIFIIFCKFTAEPELVDAILGGKLIEGVGMLVCSGKTMVHIGDIRRNMIGAGLLDCAHKVELRKEIDKLPRAHDAVKLRVRINPQDLFPRRKNIRIFVKSVDKISEMVYFLQIIFEARGAHKADRVLPYIVLTDKLVIFAAVDHREGALCEIVSCVDSVFVFVKESSRAVGGVYDTERIEIGSLIGEGGCDRHAFVAQFIGKGAAEIILSAVCIFEII